MLHFVCESKATTSSSNTRGFHIASNRFWLDFAKVLKKVNIINQLLQGNRVKEVVTRR